MPVTFIAGETIGANNDTRGIILGLIEGIDLTGFPAGTEVYVAAGGGWSATRPTGNAIIQVLGYVSKGDGPGGKGLVLNPGPNSLPNISTNKLWIGDTNSHPIQKTINEIGLATTSSLTSLSTSIALTDLNQENRLDALETSSGSLNSFTSSIDTTIKNKLNSENVVSSSTQVTEYGFAITGSNLFIGTQTISGSILPSVDNQYDLGSPTYQWRDVYISSGSLYVDGTKVLGSTEQELTITTDTGQSIKILEAGSDSIILQSADGDIELKSSGGGDILLDPTTGLISIKGTTQIQDGFKITSSGGNNIVFGDGIIVSGSIDLTGTIDGIDLTQFSSSINQRVGSLETSGVVSGSIQIDIAGTSGYTNFSSSIAITDLNQENRLNSLETKTGSYATTGSNSFLGSQNITGSLYVSENLTVYGSSSFVYVTSSQLAVSNSYISVNVFEPAERFGGLKVYDSGSESHQATASLLWDSLQNHWIYQNASGSNYSGGMLLSGPRNTGSLGEELGLTSGKIAKSVGGDHLDNSIMNEAGSTIYITGSLSATGTVYGTNITAIETSTGSLNSFTSSINTTIKNKLNNDGVISGSSQISFGSISGIPGGLVSGSSQIDLTATTNYISGIKDRLNNESVISGSGQISSLGFITGYTETDTLASVTARGASTTTYVALNGGAEVWTNPATGVGFRLKRNTGSTTGDDVVGIYLSDGAMTTIMDNDNDGDSSTFEWQYKTGGSNSTLLSFSNGSITFQGNTVYHSGNLTNLNQLTNGPGYITGYTETDTLASVTARGASTSTRTTFTEVGATRAGSDTVAAGPWFRWTNADESRQMLTQLNASNGLTTWAYNGSAWSSVFTVTQAGAGTFAGNISANNLSGTNTGDQTNITGNAGTVTNGLYTTGDQTITGQKTFPSAIANRPILAGGFISAATGDLDVDIWGISEDYYPSHATAANAWGLQWYGTGNEFRFVGGGTNRVVMDMDNGNIVSTGTISGSTIYGTWNGTAISDSYISSASNWNTAYGWGNHASGGYASASLSNNKTYTSTGNIAGSYLGGHYSSGGLEKPNSATFGAGKLKLAMLSSGNLGFGGSWNDVLWLSAYSGGDVKSSHALVFDKYSSNVWVSDQNFDSASWGTGYLLLHSGNYTSYAPSLTGSGATGTWGISISGNAATASSTGTLSSNAVTNGYLVIGGSYGNNAYNAVSSSRLLFGGGDSDALSNYYIGTNLENFGGNYTKLDLRWHTGIRMGAQPGYGGIRFFNNEDLDSVLFSIGAGDGNVRSHTNLIPSANNSYNLGSASLGWANVYTNDLHLSNMNKPGGNDIDGTNGTWTIQEGEENLYIINNKNGKRFKIDLTEIV
jgi:hypothetical protein